MQVTNSQKQIIKTIDWSISHSTKANNTTTVNFSGYGY